MDAQTAVRNALAQWAKGLTNRELSIDLDKIQILMGSRNGFREDQIGPFGAVLTEARHRLAAYAKAEAATPAERVFLDTGKFPE